MLSFINNDNMGKSDIIPAKISIDKFDRMSWGTHICLLYKTKLDLLDLLIPYIQAGLTNHEQCICLTSQTLFMLRTRMALKKAIPDFDSYYKKGQIVFYDSKEWYQHSGKLKLDKARDNLFNRLNRALAKGYKGLRIYSNNTWLDDKGWNTFLLYEAQFDEVIKDYRMMSMCSYPLDKCNAMQMRDLISSHQSTLVKYAGDVQVIERADTPKNQPNSISSSSPMPKQYIFEKLEGEKNENLQVLNEMLKAEMRRHSRAEEALQLSDRRYRSLFNAIDEGFSLFEISIANGGQIDYQCLDVNPAFELIMGSKGEDLIGRKLSEALPEIYSKLTSCLNQVATAREPVHTEEYLAGLGKILAVRILYLEVGQIVLIINDITSGKQAEESLRLSEEKFSLAFHSSPSMMTITTLEEWRYIDVNEMFCRQTGYRREEIIGRKCEDLGLWCRTEDVKTVTSMMRQGIPVQYFEVPFLSRSGERHVGLMSSELITIDGQACLLNSVNDISQRIQLQEEMARLDSLNLIGQMAASISHETRNPMTTVRGFLQMLKDKPEYRNDKEYFGIMIEELDRADSIISEFLSLAPNNKLQLEIGNINRIIGSLSVLMQADALAHDKYIELQLGDIPDQLLDPKEIRQMLLNLVRNAVEAVKPQQKVSISTYLQDESIVLEVKDAGCGMSPEVLARLGTPFLTTKEHGTGLGLSVCYNIAERHNAIIDVDSSPSGTTFFVRFRQ